MGMLLKLEGTVRVQSVLALMVAVLLEMALPPLRGKQEFWGGGRVCANEFPTKFWFPGYDVRAIEKFEIFSASNEDIGP